MDAQKGLLSVGRRQDHARQDQKSSGATQPRPIAHTSVPYVKGTSEALARVLRKEGNKGAHEPVSTPGWLIPKQKDRLPRQKDPLERVPKHLHRRDKELSRKNAPTQERSA